MSAEPLSPQIALQRSKTIAARAMVAVTSRDLVHVFDLASEGVDVDLIVDPER